MGVHHAVPWQPGVRRQGLEHATDLARAARQAGEFGNLPIRCNSAFGYASDHLPDALVDRSVWHTVREFQMGERWASGFCCFY